MQDLLAQVERALRTRGWSGRQASLMATGSPELVRGMRRGRDPSVSRFRALCEALELEFYVGPPRDTLPLDERRLELAIETAERGLAASGQTLGFADKARFFVAVYGLIGQDHAPANALRLSRLLRMISGRRTARESAVMRSTQSQDKES